MKNTYRIRLLLLSAFLGSGFAAAANTTVVVNVNVLSMNVERVLPQRTVVIVDDLITKIGHVDTVSVPKNATVIDGTDRYLIPGLAEMHAHVTSTVGADFDRLATLFVANGVTTIRGMLGRHSHLELRENLRRGAVFGPRLYTSGPSMNGRSVNGAADAARQVREQQAAGYDFIKIHPGLSRDEFIALADTANEIGMPYAGHVPVAAGVRLALTKNMSSIDHLDGYFVAMLPKTKDNSGGYGGFFDVMLANDIGVAAVSDLAAATAAAKTWNVPTEILIEQLIDDTPLSELRTRPENRYVSPTVIADWVASKEAQLADRDFDASVAAEAVRLRRKIIAELHNAGAGILLGSDAPQTFNVPGFSTQRELEVLVAAGLSPFDALRAGTVSAAKFLGSNGGSIEVGRDADMILLDANPLEDISNVRRIHGVMLRGQWLPERKLGARLETYAVNP